MEYNIIGKMLKEGLDVYIPLVDDHGVDAIIKKEDGTFVTVRMFLDYEFDFVRHYDRELKLFQLVVDQCGEYGYRQTCLLVSHGPEQTVGNLFK